MTDFNISIIEGVLAGESILRHTGDDVPVLTIEIKNVYNKNRKDVSFVECVFFGDIAKKINEEFRVNRKILLKGRLKQNKFITKDGILKDKLQVVVSFFEFLDGENE